MSNAWAAMERALDHPKCQLGCGSPADSVCSAGFCGACHCCECEPDGCFGERQGDDDAGRWERVCVQRTEEYQQFCHDVVTILNVLELYTTLGSRVRGLRDEAMDRERLLRTELDARKAFKGEGS